ncbi:transposase [Chryseobacterium sp. PMSZPI]|uniref:transposase n=1 Tax=Chryseobacterium sp. PMSZPI TaxID=1033900 RepID=UPI000C31FE6D|nr:transposase [Chryseobacterium sp. PMSZPI]PKF72473.1 transposase [Chryseobacterium sp. PMSZPI]
MNAPNYKKIYTDLIQQKYPEYFVQCQKVLSKERLSFFDIIQLNSIVSEKSEQRTKEDQKFRSYKKSDIYEILEYQKKHDLNNSQLAKHFKLSRNTIAKWKQHFI